MIRIWYHLELNLSVKQYHSFFHFFISMLLISLTVLIGVYCTCIKGKKKVMGFDQDFIAWGRGWAAGESSGNKAITNDTNKRHCVTESRKFRRKQALISCCSSSLSPGHTVSSSEPFPLVQVAEHAQRNCALLLHTSCQKKARHYTDIAQHLFFFFFTVFSDLMTPEVQK